MIDEDIVHERITRIQAYIEELRPFLSMNYPEYMNDSRNYRTVERVIQLIVDTAVEINDHILSGSGELPPGDYKQSFTDLLKLGLGPQEFIEHISKSAGMRNILVHEYTNVDAQRVYESIDLAANEYAQYCKAILEFLEKNRVQLADS